MNNCDRNCCCQNNNDEDTQALETMCNDVESYSNCYCEDDGCQSCRCGFNEEETLFPTNPMLAQSYVPIQNMDRTFTPCCGLKNGTIFPELVTTYYPGQSMMEIDYLRMRNEIGKGCNKCS